MATRLKIRVIPRARRNEISGWRGDALVVRLTAPPVKGAANRMLSEFLAQQLNVRASDVTVVSGTNSRTKVIEIEGLSEAQLTLRLPSHE